MSIGIGTLKQMDTYGYDTWNTMSMLGQRLKELRKRKGFTQTQLADRSKVAQGTISRYEQDQKARYDMDTLAALGRALGVSAEYLQTGLEPAAADDLSVDPYLAARHAFAAQSQDAGVEGNEIRATIAEVEKMRHKSGPSTFDAWFAAHRDQLRVLRGRRKNKGIMGVGGREE